MGRTGSAPWGWGHLHSSLRCTSTHRRRRCSPSLRRAPGTCLPLHPPGADLVHPSLALQPDTLHGQHRLLLCGQMDLKRGEPAPTGTGIAVRSRTRLYTHAYYSACQASSAAHELLSSIQLLDSGLEARCGPDNPASDAVQAPLWQSLTSQRDATIKGAPWAPSALFSQCRPSFPDPLSDL